MAQPSLREATDDVRQAEGRTRIELAALYRALSIYGMSDLANQVVAARVEGAPDRALTHVYGTLYEEVTASGLVGVTCADGAVDGDAWVSDGAKNLCRWIFGSRPDTNVFIHGHCEDVMAVGSIASGLLPLSQPAVYLMHLTTYLDYEFHEDEEFAESFIRTLAGHQIMISHNHGYYVLGRTAAEAFFRAYYLRQACAVQMKVMASGDAPRLIDRQRAARYQDQMYASEHYNYDGSTEWSALLRKLERECPDYKN